MVLDWFKHRPEARHVPVHVISALEERRKSLTLGAWGHTTKPASRPALDAAFAGLARLLDDPARAILVVEDDDRQRGAVRELLAADDVTIVEARSGAAAMEALGARAFDCVVLDLKLPDMSGIQLLRAIRREIAEELKVVVYTGKQLTARERGELARAADAVVLKEAGSPERLLDEVSLFLHRAPAHLPPAQQRLLAGTPRAEPILTGRKVLIVDDDVRNIFALTTVLERHGLRVPYAENGRDAVEVLAKERDIDLVLMDIMMPEMDGYETMRAIRRNAAMQSLPIIALTAKAMRGDREKCIAAGASDYISKPVEVDRLMSLLRVWLLP
jgi:CheY-like chemotaxis protein